MTKQRKIPMRMCIGCKESKPKIELIRIVKNKEEEIFIDFTGRKNGRGAYICKNISCLESAQKSNRLEKAFEMKIDASIYNGLREQLENAGRPPHS